MEEKIGGAEQGNEELAEGSAEDADGVAEPTEEEMAAFVDEQIDVIKDEKAGTVKGGVKKEESVETEPRDSGEAGDRLPGAEFFFQRSH